MSQVGIRELKQNASAVVAEAAAGGEVTITDRGRPVALLVPIAAGRLDELVAAGRARPAKRPLSELPAPSRRKSGQAPLSAALADLRDAERY